MAEEALYLCVGQDSVCKSPHYLVVCIPLHHHIASLLQLQCFGFRCRQGFQRVLLRKGNDYLYFDPFGLTRTQEDLDQSYRLFVLVKDCS